jgi:hypothetical protein
MPVRTEDKFFLLFEGLGPPVTALWGLVVQGADLDRDRFGSAVGRLLERHPKAAARLVRRSSSDFSWQPLPDAAAKACHFHEPRPAPTGPQPDLQPLVEILNTPLDPGVGPLLHLHWIPDGDGSGTLGFRFHHSLGDGHGSLALLRDLLTFYNGGEPQSPPPDYTDVGEPLVSGTRLAKLRLFGRLLAFHFRRSRAYRFAPPAKLFDLRRRSRGVLAAAGRTVSSEKTERYLAAARRTGTTFNNLLLAAHGLALDRWLRDQGLPSGTFRIMVNQSLRSKDREPDRAENRSSAFPVWIGPRDRQAGPAIVQRVHSQVQECQDLRVAEATALLGGLLRLPFGLARRLVLPAATRPRMADSLVLSNMGRLPDSHPDKGWFHLGAGRIVGALPFVRPPDGVGALSFALTLGGRLCLNWCFLEGLLEQVQVQSLLAHLESALDELSGGREPL